MNTIWKFPLGLVSHFPGITKIMAPAGAKPRFVGLDCNEVPSVWMEVEDTQCKAPILLAVVGTGHEIPDHLPRYVGSFLIPKHGFVFHVYTR